MRSATNWHNITDGASRAIHVITSNEVGVPAVGIASVRDLTSTAPPRRMVGRDWQDQGAIDPDDVPSPAGTTLYGRHKGERPDITDMLAIDPVAARLVIAWCVETGYGYEAGEVFAAARKRLGMSQAELGLALDMAAGNSDLQARARNVGRTIRRYEDEGAPVMAAHALRWLSHRAGILITSPEPPDMTTMTKAEFDALRPLNPDQIREERDGAYLYEIITDAEGNDVAFASWRNGACEGYTRVARD